MLVVYAVTAVFILNCDFLAHGNELSRVPLALTQKRVIATNYADRLSVGIIVLVSREEEDDSTFKPLASDFFVYGQSSVSDFVTALSLSTEEANTEKHSETTTFSISETPVYFPSSPSSVEISSVEETLSFDTPRATWRSSTVVSSTTSNDNSTSSLNSSVANRPTTLAGTMDVVNWTSLSTTLSLDEGTNNRTMIYDTTSAYPGLDITAEFTSSCETADTESSTTAAATNETSSGSTFSDSTSYTTTSRSTLTSSNPTTQTMLSQPDLEVSTTRTTSISAWITAPTTTTPPCECESMELVLGRTRVGSNWFAVPFNLTTSNPLCVDWELTRLDVTLYGPFDKEEFPQELQTCSPSIDCLSGTNNSFLFNSTLCCKRTIVVRQCSHYTFTMIPQYTSCVGHPVNTSVFTLPGPDAVPNEIEILQTGSDWVEISWQDLKFCERTITAYLMSFSSFYPDGSSNFQTVRVPLECTNRSLIDEVTVFDSRTCPELLILEACSIYSVVIQVELFDMYRSQSSSNVTFYTKPPVFLLTHIDEPVESGSDWLAFRWNMSIPQCQMATTGFQFHLTNVRGNSSELYRCNATVHNTLDPKFLFNTSSSECDRKIIVPPCSDYQFSVVPTIFGIPYNEYSDNALGRTLCETIAPFILSIKTGSDWISFNWTTSVQDCREVLTGFWLSIAPSTLKSKGDDNLQFISMADCYCNLKTNQEIMFNTSFSCSNTWTSPGIFPCSEYDIYLIPQFFGSLNGSANVPLVTETIPGDQITPVTQNIEAGKHWISFEYQAVTESCRKAVTGLWITMDSISPNPTVNNRNQQYFCSSETMDDTFISFNTSSSCFHEQILSPCHYYTFDIQLDINGQVGRLSKVNRTTTPGYDATALISAQNSGTHWISFEWQSSVQGCQKLINTYQLNVTDLSDGVSQWKNLSRSCSVQPLVIGFNSSLPCAGLEISPCSNYLVSLVPQFRIGDLIITGISAITEIGSKSGEWGEIEQPTVASQGTNSLTLTWFEPICRASANLIYYNVTIIPNWKLGTHVVETFLKIKPDCLDKMLNGQVSMTLNETICHQGYKFVSCAPYIINVLPVYQLPSANDNLVGWETDTQTLPMQNEASVNNLTVQEVDTRWITLSWPIPTCRLPLIAWNLKELSSEIGTILPSDCPTYVNATHLTLNISDSILCSNNSTVVNFEVSFTPCTNYTLGMYVKYSDLDVQPGTSNNNIVSVTTDIEAPGIVSNLTWSGTTNSILLQWDVPKKNPQCVESYRVVWNNQENFTTDTYAFKNSLRPCTRILASVYSLPNSTTELHDSVFVSTESVDPAPVNSGVNVTSIDNGCRRNVSWLKPEIDDCITGYKVNIRKATTMELVYNKTIPWKNLTWLLLNDGFEPEYLYNISIATYCSFKEEILVSNAISHVFTWDSASSMINTTLVVCGIIFSILALMILYGAVILRQSQMTVLSPSFTLDEDKQTSVNKSLRTLNGRKPILVNELKQTIEWLEADSGYELSKEFESIRFMSSHQATCSVANLPENLSKNRYCDILPYDHTRVKLINVQGKSSQSDYINASYVSGSAGKRVYIATQGPKPSTIEDFWLMCFEQDVKLIVALTSLEERGRVKCAQYWPSTASCEYGNMYVEQINETEESYYTIRDFLVTRLLNGGTSAAKFTRQMHYTAWPDFGCPENPEQLINFIHAMRAESSSFYNTYKIACPIIVHCSAGVGRTGTLIALDILMEQARRKKIIDVLNTVLKIRGDRDRMVQTEEQYHFLYKCIESYCRNELQLKDHLSLYSVDHLTPSRLAPLSLFQKDPDATFSAV